MIISSRCSGRRASGRRIWTLILSGCARAPCHFLSSSPSPPLVAGFLRLSRSASGRSPLCRSAPLFVLPNMMARLPLPRRLFISVASMRVFSSRLLLSAPPPALSVSGVTFPLLPPFLCFSPSFSLQLLCLLDVSVLLWDFSSSFFLLIFRLRFDFWGFVRFFRLFRLFLGSLSRRRLVPSFFLFLASFLKLFF